MESSEEDLVTLVKKEVERIKQSDEMRAEYMSFLLELQDQRYEGIIEGIERTACNMLKENMPLELIAKVTNLPLERIRALQTEDN